MVCPIRSVRHALVAGVVVGYIAACTSPTDPDSWSAEIVNRTVYDLRVEQTTGDYGGFGTIAGVVAVGATIVLRDLEVGIRYTWRFVPINAGDSAAVYRTEFTSQGEDHVVIVPRRTGSLSRPTTR